MPPLGGFSDNPFRNRADLVRAAEVLVKPLQRYQSPGKALIKLATATGAGFSETAAQLEGFSRPLWIIPSLLQQMSDDSDLHLTSWLEGLKTGTDPASPEYWGDIGDFDQRAVETESIAFALLVAPERFVPSDPAERDRLAAWLRQINHVRLPENNWSWFRVFVSFALMKALGVPMEEVREVIERDLRLLDSFYVGDGWSTDGLWGDERKQADYYSGSFALQFAQLLYVRLSDGYDNARAERYKNQAREFALGYWRYFDTNGAAIPFGRSLTYRYACAAFWSAVALAEVTLPAPLDHPGTVKGLLMRHLRWWSQHPDIFNTDGTHNIGYAYPNMYMSENYNSPQSVYWCLKAFVVLQLPEDHAFWRAEELPHPLSSSSVGQDRTLSAVSLLWPPRHILCSTPEHHFLLSAGQFTRKDHKAREAKYGKFAYSSAFGFSVPTGPLLGQLAPDSTLCLSIDDGESWKVASEPYHVRSEIFQVGEEEVQSLISRWKPWRNVELEVETTLLAPTKRWPGWHFRFHTLVWSSAALLTNCFRTVKCVDAGFAISAQHNGVSLFETACGTTESLAQADTPRPGWWTGEKEAVVISEAGASGAAELAIDYQPPPPPQQASSHGFEHRSYASVLRPDANTNLIAPRTLLPCIRHDFNLVSETKQGNTVSSDLPTQVRATFALGVFAVAASSGLSIERQRACWLDRPSGLTLLNAKSLKIE